jgi:hypothetical protein
MGLTSSVVERKVKMAASAHEHSTINHFEAMTALFYYYSDTGAVE